MRQIWIIMPALNEAENLDWILPELVKKYSVVVVDNGSSDGTDKIARKHGAFLVHCSQKGYGIAVQTGISLMENLCQENSEDLSQNIVVVFDADGTSPISGLETATKLIIEGQDLAIGQRLTLKKGSMPKHSEFGNWLQVKLIGMLTGVYFQDMGPLRAVRYDKLKSLLMVDKTWGWNVEMQIKAAQKKLKIDEFPVIYNKRRYGKSKISGSFVGSIRAATRIIYTIFYYYLISLKTREKP